MKVILSLFAGGVVTILFEWMQWFRIWSLSDFEYTYWPMSFARKLATTSLCLTLAAAIYWRDADSPPMALLIFGLIVIFGWGYIGWADSVAQQGKAKQSKGGDVNADVAM
jgi:hypothetical protein